MAAAGDLKLRIGVDRPEIVFDPGRLLMEIATRGLIIEGPGGATYKVRIASTEENGTQRPAVQPTRSW